MKIVIQIGIFFLVAFTFAQSPVNKNATKEAKKLLSYIYSLEDSIISGQHTYNRNLTEFYDLAKSISGKNPAIWGTDFYWAGEKDPGKSVVAAAKEMHTKGAIITLMWHVGKPTDDAPFKWKKSTQGELNEKEWEALVTPGTPLFKRWEAQVDNVAKYLKELQKANIPVLWRPYHEMNGVWFWWGDKKGDKGYIQLWKNLYERLVTHHQLNNLLWVWNANGPRDIPNDQAYAYKHYYPGPEYVDILATDVYHFDYEQKDYNELLELANGKPIALGEVGELPKADILEAQPKWSWFMVWSNWIETANTKERVQEIYNRSKTISRDDLPKF
ncbi:glycosyl hydrolase family 26 [Galbibacter sp. BG1]|uniref:glycosyl hydrolase n=1 Tax=Galbibacter sp. BG1 TaxID=1170699 RepID=UPI0015BACCBD|nr:glycosyl hydrolase [Galbibacter sp. BG1]QLE01008.1 glycosyl hydrolase family 26 [Galbibacter sp. BG1]